MLTALEQGVRGGRWHTLIDKVYALPTLRAAFARVKANRGAPGVDHVTVAMFETRLDANLAAAVDGAARRAPIVRSRFAGTGFRKGRASGARSGFRRCATASCKPPCVWCWNPSSTRRLPRTATAFARSAAPSRRCAGW